MKRPEPQSEKSGGPLLSVVGPTATGKSALAVDIALAVGGEIVSCDSMAVYRGLDIGTDKPTRQEMRGVPHHLLDVADPGSLFSAGEFRRMALEAVEAIWGRGRVAILAGGTGLYYRALTKGLLNLPARQPELRERLASRIKRDGSERVFRILQRFDPAYASTIGKRDSLRICRAMEVFMTTGKPLSAWIEEAPFGSSSLEGAKIGLTAELSFLRDRIDRRVDAMMKSGFLEEVKSLNNSGLLRGPARKAIGYGELAAFLDGNTSLEEAVEEIRRRSRKLAKRQFTWFRKEDGIEWFDIRKEGWKDDVIKYVSGWLAGFSGKEGGKHTESVTQLYQKG